MKMSTIYRLAAAIAVLGVALLAINGPASAATRPASVNYCLQYSHGGSDCSFTSKAQCEATASGQSAECFRNYYGKEGETLHW
jgi:hypothetical protein